MVSHSNRIISGRFIRRINRFEIECLIDGRMVRAYLPNPGRLYEILIEGEELFLIPSGSQNLRFRVIGAPRDGINILLDTHETNSVAKEIIDTGLIEEFEGFRVVDEEVRYGDSRFDLLLKRGSKKILLEVKSCTLFYERLAMFPDAVSERARRHIMRLSRINESGLKGAILFVINSPYAEYFLPEFHTDPDFSRSLYDVRNKIILKTVRVNYRDDFYYFEYAGEAEIPWNIYIKEGGDRGAYILGLFLDRDRTIQVGSGKKFDLKKGFYLYTGSALKNLTSRLNRHKRTRKSLFWHIDYLREYADYLYSFPIRTEDDIECKIARTLMRIADATVEGFGSSDCNCKGHLFYFKEDPLKDFDFVKIIQYFRMGRLLEKYEL